MWESSQWLRKNIVRSTGHKNSRKQRIGAVTSHRCDISEVMLEMTLNIAQSVKQSQGVLHGSEVKCGTRDPENTCYSRI